MCYLFFFLFLTTIVIIAITAITATAAAIIAATGLPETMIAVGPSAPPMMPIEEDSAIEKATDAATAINTAEIIIERIIFNFMFSPFSFRKDYINGQTVLLCVSFPEMQSEFFCLLF